MSTLLSRSRSPLSRQKLIIALTLVFVSGTLIKLWSSTTVRNQLALSEVRESEAAQVSVPTANPIHSLAENAAPIDKTVIPNEEAAIPATPLDEAAVQATPVVEVMPLKEPLLPVDDWSAGALVNYSDLCHFPTMQLDFKPTTMEERAIVTALFTDGYAHTVAVLGHSLRRVKVKARLIVIYIPGQIAESSLCLAKTQGWEPVAVERIPPPHNGHLIHPALIDQYTKLQLWSFDSLGIRSLIYLDADTLVLRPIPETLFDLPFTFAAVPDGIDKPLINGGVLFIKTDTRIRDDMVSKLETAEYNLSWAEQNFLNLYWGGHILLLPWLFNGNIWMKFQSPKLWRGMKDELVVVHYTSAKPIPARQSVTLTLEEMQKAIQYMMETQLDWEEELRWWGDRWLDMKELTFRELTNCVPARNLTGSRERLDAAGVPVQYG